MKQEGRFKRKYFTNEKNNNDIIVPVFGILIGKPRLSSCLVVPLQLYLQQRAPITRKKR